MDFTLTPTLTQTLTLTTEVQTRARHCTQRAYCTPPRGTPPRPPEFCRVGSSSRSSLGCRTWPTRLTRKTRLASLRRVRVRVRVRVS